ncbi:VENN motif pre-toxin domain-containing protein, partial [Kingella negevensis]|uniref:VENN motif pre-toxin domain-containing protein n=1 Tax=Kingella negevensis TaxID=1522312 RepID=UPI002550ED19
QEQQAGKIQLNDVARPNPSGFSSGYGHDSDHQESTTRSGIATRNIILTDENGQLAQTGYGTDKAAQLAYTDIRSEDAGKQSGSLKNRFDAAAVQNELDFQRNVSQQFSQTVGTAQGMLNEKIDALKQQHQAGDITEADYAQKLKQLQYSQVFLNMVAAALSAPTDSAAGIAAATASPALSYQIGQYFKGLAQENPDGRLTAGQETAHILAHGVLGAAVSAAGGNDALAGALASGGAEAAAPVIGKWVYGKDDGVSLSAEEKETVSAITRMLGTTAGAAVGNSAVDAVRGGMAGQNAVENNHLREGQRIQKNAEFRACKADWRCEFDVDEKWEQIGLNNMKELYAACDKGINTAACQNLRNQIDRSTYQGKRDYNYPTGLELKGELSGALGVGVQANGKVTVTLGNRGSSVQAEGGVGLGIGAALSGGLSKQTRHVGIDENKTLNVSTEIVLGEKQFGTQADNKNATLSTKVEAELKLGPLNHSAAIQGGRQYPDNQASSLYRGEEVKSVVKPQLGIGGMLKWDIWNGRSKRYEKIR